VNPQEITAYLAASHMAVVATIHLNGTPHLTPNGYRYEGKLLTLITRTDRLTHLNLQRHHRISVHHMCPLKAIWALQSVVAPS